IGVSVYIPETKSGVATNVYGFYSITLPEGTYTLESTYVGYTKFTKQLTLTQNITLDIELRSELEELEEVVITAEDDENARVQNLEMGVSRLNILTIQKMPAFLGEADVIKSLQAL